jgi:hypothetical protein
MCPGSEGMEVQGETSAERPQVECIAIDQKSTATKISDPEDRRPWVLHRNRHQATSESCLLVLLMDHRSQKYGFDCKMLQLFDVAAMSAAECIGFREKSHNTATIHPPDGLRRRHGGNALLCITAMRNDLMQTLKCQQLYAFSSCHPEPAARQPTQRLKGRRSAHLASASRWDRRAFCLGLNHTTKCFSGRTIFQPAAQWPKCCISSSFGGFFFFFNVYPGARVWRCVDSCREFNSARSWAHATARHIPPS